MTPLQPQRKIFSSANLCKYNFQVWLMRQAGFINHGLPKVSIIITNAMTRELFYSSVLQMLFFNIDSDCRAQSFLQTDIVVHYTPHDRFLTSENKERNQPAWWLSNDFLAHPLSF